MITPVIATTDPMDRSMPPEMMTIVIATEMMPMVETATRMLSRFRTLMKYGHANHFWDLAAGKHLRRSVEEELEQAKLDRG